jgi:trehalose/maltose transport system permease protein
MKTRNPWLFCLPAALVLISVALWPLLRTFLLSFTDAKLSELGAFHWVGARHFARLIQDPDWWQAVLNTVIFVVVSVTLETLLALAIALVLNREFPGRALLTAAVLVPWAIPTVVSAKIWSWMFNDVYGVINRVLLAAGVLNQPIAWLAEQKYALLTVVLVDVWKTTPFLVLLLLAGLRGVPRSLYEAARLEGASPPRMFFHITLPLIRPALLVALIFRTMDSVRVFDLPYVLTSNSRKTAVISTFARQQLIDFQDIGYGSAASVLIFLVIAMFMVVYLGPGRKHLGLAQ